MTNMVHEISFMSEGKTIPVVRVPGHDHAAIGYALDAGASIVIPQVNTVEEARHVVSAAKFGSKHNGTRSAPPFRLLPGLTDTPIDPSMSVFENVNSQAAVIIQIESLEAINNLDAILTEVPDIDAVWLGSLDCRTSMGLSGMAGNEPEWLETVAKYKSILKKHDMPDSGVAIGPPEIQAAAGKGKAFVVVTGDVPTLMAGFGELQSARQLFSPLQWEGKTVKESNKLTNGTTPFTNGMTHGNIPVAVNRS
jgi:2-keto-3-deoxy-L-rhamnonate aldolase RhmA